MKKIWLVGASEGIGRALAIELARQGNLLVISGRNQQRLDNLLSELGGSPHLAIALDVTDKQTIASAWALMQTADNAIDVVIYCAGYYKPMPANHMEIDEIEKMIDVNLTGSMRILSYVIPDFIKKRQGHIVLIGSSAGYRGLPNALGYGSSKAGIIHLAENLYCDLHQYKIKVQVINPGFVKTRLTDLNKFQMPSLLSPEQAAKSIVECMKDHAFELRFPFLFANFLKLMSKLPYSLYFKIISQIPG